MSMKPIQAGLTILGDFLHETEGFTTKVMAMNPVNSLLMINLLGNLGYALTTEKLEFGWKINPGEATSPIQTTTYETRQELIAAVFRNTAEKSGQLMGADIVKDLMGAGGFTTLLRAIT